MTKSPRAALAALVACAFLALSCASVARSPFENVRPDRSRGIQKVLELGIDDGRWDAKAARRVAQETRRVARTTRRGLRPSPAALAPGGPVLANPCGGSIPTTSTSPGSGSGPTDYGGNEGGNGLIGVAIGIAITVVFGLIIWGMKKLWRVFFPAPPELPTAHEPGRVLALIRLDGEKAMRATATDLAAPLGLTVEGVHRLRATDDGLLVFSHPGPDVDLAELVNGLEADDRVHLAQRDYWFDAVARYDDPLDEMNWGPERIGAGRLHPTTRGAGVRVALVDTGVDAGHQDLHGRVVEQIDVTGRGLAGELHGTALAGVIAAAPDDGFGTWGVAPDVELVVAKACEPAEEAGLEARCWSSTLARGLDFAIRREARVVNLSVAGPEERLVTRLVNAAIRKGALVVAAAGNGGKNGPPFFPGALDGVLTVTAVDADDNLYEEATRGDQVDVAAPGVDIVADAPDGTFPPLSGTSFATAHVTGAAALLLGAFPDLSSVQLKALLEGSAVDLGKGDRDAKFGAGRVDVCAAAERLSDGAAVCVPLEPGDAAQ